MTPGGTAPLTEIEVDALLAPLGSFDALVLAVSGGADSTALMHLVHAWTQRRGRGVKGVVAVTVDHGLRDDSAAEAAEVAQQARALGIAHRTVSWTGDKPSTGLQSAARAIRYRYLCSVAREIDPASGGSVAIVTAHTADDQAETLLMRLARGSGVDGLASIPFKGWATVSDGPAGPHYPVLRPLLGVRRTRLVATLAAAGVTFAEDPSNRDLRFERVRVREALAKLESIGLAPEALSRTAARMQSAQTALERLADDLQASAVSSVSGIVHEIDLALLANAPAETAVRVLRRVLAHAGGAAPPAELSAVEDAARRILSVDRDKISFTLGGCIVEASTGSHSRVARVTVYREPDRGAGLPTVVVKPGQCVLWDERFRARVHAGYDCPVEVGPLGAEWATLQIAYPALLGLSLPAAAARGMPAFRRGGRVVAVPLLAQLARHSGDGRTADALAGPACTEDAGGLQEGVGISALQIVPVDRTSGRLRRATNRE